MQRLEDVLTKIYVVVFPVFIGFWFVTVFLLIGNFLSVTIWVLFTVYTIAVVLMLRTIIIRIPAVKIGVLESLISGLFLPEEYNECGCSVPIRESLGGGIHLKRPWHVVHLFGSEINTLIIEAERYDIRKGAVIVSGIVQWRVSSLCAYRALAISRDGIEKGMSAIIDQVLVTKLIGVELEEALKLKNDLRESIEKAFNDPAMVDKEDNKIHTKEQIKAIAENKERNEKILEPRILRNKIVSIAEHRYGITITDVNIDKIDPIEELQDARSNIQVEELKKLATAMKMERFGEMTSSLKSMFPNMSDEQIGEKLEIIEGLLKKQKNLFGISDLPEIIKLVRAALEHFKK